MPAYNSFSSIAEKHKGLEHLIKISSKKCGFLLTSQFSIPFFWRYFTCSTLAFLAHVLPFCHKWVISLKHKLSQSLWLKYCATYHQLDVFSQAFMLFKPSFPPHSSFSTRFSPLVSVRMVTLPSFPRYISSAWDSTSASSAKTHFSSHLDKFTFSGSEPSFSPKSSSSSQSWKQEKCTFCLWCCHLSPINCRTQKSASITHELHCPPLAFWYHLHFL